MPYFRKKPVIIEAVQWQPGIVHPGVYCRDGSFYVITIHGQETFIAPNDWLIPEPKEGHYYPCKPDIFANTYELLES